MLDSLITGLEKALKANRKQAFDPDAVIRQLEIIHPEAASCTIRRCGEIEDIGSVWVVYKHDENRIEHILYGDDNSHFYISRPSPKVSDTLDAGNMLSLVFGEYRNRVLGVRITKVCRLGDSDEEMIESHIVPPIPLVYEVTPVTKIITTEKRADLRFDFVRREKLSDFEKYDALDALKIDVCVQRLKEAELGQAQIWGLDLAEGNNIELKSSKEAVEFIQENMPAKNISVFLTKPYVSFVDSKTGEEKVKMISLGYYELMEPRKGFPEFLYIKMGSGQPRELERILKREISNREKVEAKEGFSLKNKDDKIGGPQLKINQPDKGNDVVLLSFLGKDNIHYTVPCEFVEKTPRYYDGMNRDVAVLMPKRKIQEGEERHLKSVEFACSGYRAKLLDFSMGGAKIIGSDDAAENERFLEYLIGRGYKKMSLDEQIEAIQGSSIYIDMFPSFRTERIELYEPNITDAEKRRGIAILKERLERSEPDLPYSFPLIAEIVKAFNDGKRITCLAMRFTYQPLEETFLRTVSRYKKWRAITPATENPHIKRIYSGILTCTGILSGAIRNRELQ